FADYEADYIRVFQVGRRGQPIVHLSAGDYQTLIGSGSRPEFLLEYSGWYRHFGLKTNEEDQANEFPDHIVCQLEFLAWLSHLEHTSADKPPLQQGYQCAQRDFAERHLQQFLELMVSALQAKQQESSINPFFLNVSTLALDVVNAMQNQFNKALGDSVGKIHDPDHIASVNLWG
ncbi:MAG: molecular chaperone TorD family protein, partial [Halioglobus sp.]